LKDLRPKPLIWWVSLRDPFEADQPEELTVEFLVTMTTRVPDGTPEQEVNDVRARKAARSRELAAQAAEFLTTFTSIRTTRPPPRPDCGAG
jgi:hypothetical protein